MTRPFDLAVLLGNWKILAAGYVLTLGICGAALILALLGGGCLALARLGRAHYLRVLSVAYIETFRNIPFLIQIFLWYYVLPFVGFRLPAAIVGLLALGAYGSAYFAEIVRGAIESVPRGQLESARVTGMSYGQAMRHIIFPQMLGYLIPPATNQATSLIKESSLLSTITVMELTMSGQVIQSATYSYVEVLIAIALLYWATNETLARVSRRLESALQPYKRPRAALNDLDTPSPLTEAGK
jgi:His/Glu/Gln/Arg/opine family amino acid ABC transporter permease subunit